MEFLGKQIKVTANHSIAIVIAMIMTVLSMISTTTTGATWFALLLTVLFLFAMVYIFTRIIRNIAGEMTSIAREFSITFSAYAAAAIVFAIVASNGTVDVSDFTLGVIADSILPTLVHIGIVYLYKDKEVLDEN